MNGKPHAQILNVEIIATTHKKALITIFLPLLPLLGQVRLGQVRLGQGLGLAVLGIKLNNSRTDITYKLINPLREQSVSIKEFDNVKLNNLTH